MENPIKNNRYVNDIRFSTKLMSFMEYIGKRYGNTDDYVKQEWKYFYDIAKKLQMYQRESSDAEDSDYFANIDTKRVLNN